MKRFITTLFLAAAAFVASGTAALACDTVEATITDVSDPDNPVEYADGGWMLIVDTDSTGKLVGVPPGARVSEEEGGVFSVTVSGNIGEAKAIISLYRPEGAAALPPIVRSVTMNGVLGTCVIAENVGGAIYTSMTGPDSIAF